MNDKITFEEIIASTAQETDQSKTAAGDFLHDLIHVIREKLLQNEKITIAGLGKFELEQVDERGGFNPQTQEPMTIPAHKKVVFKPYKDLRETVNKPYAHLEPQLLDEDTDERAPSYIPKALSQNEKGATHPNGMSTPNGTFSSKMILDNWAWIVAGMSLLSVGVAAWLILKNE
jgi:nucleoid DNA-binding protein